MNTPGKNTDYDEINDNSNWAEKLNVAINIIRETNGPTILDYHKLKISYHDEKLFDAKLKETRFVKAQENFNAYHPTYFTSDEGLLKLEEYGNYSNFLKQKDVKEENFPKKKPTSISDMLSSVSKPFSNKFLFIHKDHIEALEKIKNSSFDLSKLLRLCKETNDSYELENYYSVGVLIRMILDHIPPILEKKSFSEVANNYGSKSFRETMLHLENSSRKIADGFLHSQIKPKETLPNSLTIECRNSLDSLLAEIVVYL